MIILHYTAFFITKKSQTWLVTFKRYEFFGVFSKFLGRIVFVAKEFGKFFKKGVHESCLLMAELAKV